MSAEFSGIGVVPGRVVAPALTMPEPVSAPVAKPAPADPDAEAQRIREASAAVHAELRERAETVTGDARDVLKATALMAKDPTLVKTAIKRLSETDAETAIWTVAAETAAQLEKLGGYMAERAADVLDVRARLVARLRGVPAPGLPHSSEPFVLIATDLAPADTATLDPGLVLGLVCEEGGPQSHTAILARSLGIPAVVAAAGVRDIAEHTPVFVDGGTGVVRTGPGDSEAELVAAWKATVDRLKSFTGPCLLADGTRIPLRANVGDGAQARAAAAAGAEGVGLLRTEFCFLDRDTEPSVEEQAEAYGQVFAAFDDHKVVVRTLDAGADKPLPFLTDTDEPNPALGVRGFRTSRKALGVLERQLEAIAVAAAKHAVTVHVMAPMIATADEARQFSELVHAAGLPVAGVMVEVPSAALRAALILDEVEFASIGTNDLTQYVMASDRMLGGLAELSDSWQPAVLQLIGMTASQGAGAEKSVGVCGEAAADPALAVVLVGLGVTSLSMAPRALPAVAEVLAGVTVEQARQIARRALAARGPAEAKAAVRADLPILNELGL
ncbi:phosphoenolpyruvate--protein phosphotransferase [Brevibacterium spongiae]|uniref:Phosphoenolpyruvate-protein phosphotransferase n=1 Tax=Brevibacterium spongiae TaxID=2909672 RepID=A0ABY5SPQ2_9MICO|nr:phosphoenolpyruvate--protein phosphotransferase [Brevibacterium spongiae]UVI35031.1 phosphoenolpyruvate--protein phosphotransferase [Brevibacterium spongiae]